MHARFPLALIAFVVRSVVRLVVKGQEVAFSCERTLPVLLAVLAHDGAGGSWASIATLARESGKSESAVHRALRALVLLGVLLGCRRRRGNGSDSTSIYRLAPKWAALLGCRSGQGEGAIDGTPFDLPNNPKEQPPTPPAACDPAVGLEVHGEAGGDTPPAPPALVPTAVEAGGGLSPTDRAAACLALLAWNGEAYPAAHGGRAYLPDVRADGRAVPKIVRYAEAAGCRTVPAVGAWCSSYLSRFWTLGGKAADFGHRLSAAVKLAEFCRPRPRPTVVPRPETVPTVDPAAFRRAAAAAASSGCEFAASIVRRAGGAIAAG